MIEGNRVMIVSRGSVYNNLSGVIVRIRKSFVSVLLDGHDKPLTFSHKEVESRSAADGGKEAG